MILTRSEPPRCWMVPLARTCRYLLGQVCANTNNYSYEWWDFPMPLTRLIRPCHPKNLSVNHLYPIELSRIWGATPFHPQRRPVSNSSNWGLSQLPTLCNNFNKIEGLYQVSPPGFHYFTSWTKDGDLTGLEPAHTQHFSSTTPQGVSLPRALPTELQELSSPLFNVLDKRTNTACGIRTHEA